MDRLSRMAIAWRRRVGGLSVGSVFLRIGLLVAIIVVATDPALAQSVLEARGEAGSPPPLAGRPEAAVPIWAPLKPQKQLAPYFPITPRQRLRWFITYTFGASHLAGGVFASGLGTAFNRPPEYGPHWSGFADRYGMRLTGIIPQNAMEAGLGLGLGEDPRYFSARGLPFKERLENVINLTFMSRRMDGSYGPAYARFMAVTSANFMSNSWRVRSEANGQQALVRIGGGLAGRMVVNAFEEFWPSVKDHVFGTR